MVHLGTMPGTPFYEEGTFEATFDKAMGDAEALFKGGATGCLIQTVDRVYSTKDESDPGARCRRGEYRARRGCRQPDRNFKSACRLCAMR